MKADELAWGENLKNNKEVRPMCDYMQAGNQSRQLLGQDAAAWEGSCLVLWWTTTHSWTRKLWSQCSSHQEVLSKCRCLSTLSQCWDVYRDKEIPDEMDIEGRRKAKSLEHLYRKQIYELGKLQERKKYKDHWERSSLKTLQMRWQREQEGVSEHLRGRWCWILLGSETVEGKYVELKWTRCISYSLWWFFCERGRKCWVSQKDKLNHTLYPW